MMIDHSYDPYEQLQQLEIVAMSHEQEIEEMKSVSQRQAQLMELMAQQVKHLTNAVIGLQNINKNLNERLGKIEGVEQ